MSQSKNKKFITKELFDVRPVDNWGNVDFEKISKSDPIVKIKRKRFFPSTGKRIGDVFYDVKVPTINEAKIQYFRKTNKSEKNQHLQNSVVNYIKKQSFSIPIGLMEIHQELYGGYENQPTDYFKKFEPAEINRRKRKRKRNFLSEWNLDRVSRYSLTNPIPSFAIGCFLVLIIISAFSFFGRGLSIKDVSLANGNKAYASLMEAKNGLSSKDYKKAQFKFNEAYDQFNSISSDIGELGGILVKTSKYIPFASKLSSGAHLAAAGKNISQIGAKSSEIISTLDKIKNPLNENDGSISLLKIFQDTDGNLKEISVLSKGLEDNLDNIDINDIPENQREKFIELKKKMPQVNEMIAGFMDNSSVFTDILGGNGPRKYLFLFQNNQEMRATGGFIGSYGVLDIFNGRINKFFIDGIFNPDGQLREKVIPPAPIQKVSAAWSLHDSNWFPDFPVSAEKASWFYEKTGGPTIDGVITMTPTVLQKLLEVTGPIEMPEYDVTIDKDNFIEKTQFEVEIDYDKEINQPKKILSDLAPKILDKIFNARDINTAAKIMGILSDSLSEKQLLIYSKNYSIQKILSERGWSGEILDTQKDYLSVINTNINGFKTDGVIDEKISHMAEINDDGSITDTVTISRHHNGGDSQYDWWNKVNADYMRIYVPKGSKLLSVNGQTREFNSPPLDYLALGFKSDLMLQMEENETEVDENSGTRIYEDAGKTVFANWTYVSPKETMEITYKYILPFKFDTDKKAGLVDSYSILFQKQSGSIGSSLSSIVTYPDFLDSVWQYPGENVSNLADEKNGIKMDDVLATDKFFGVALTKKQ
ncbi:MAG TPA: DUF4012 domain-containing protein [Patescibacteria group bacterium]|nr:DUF4012 domain-containing protein [Patescibacteria group bacterium]